MASDPLIPAHLISCCIQSHTQVPELISSVSKVLFKELAFFSTLKWGMRQAVSFHFLPYSLVCAASRDSSDVLA